MQQHHGHACMQDAHAQEQHAAASMSYLPQWLAFPLGVRRIPTEASLSDVSSRRDSTDSEIPISLSRLPLPPSRRASDRRELTSSKMVSLLPAHLSASHGALAGQCLLESCAAMSYLQCHASCSCCLLVSTC